MDHKPKLLDLVRYTIGLKHYSVRTECVYVDWIKRSILCHAKCHPASMGAPFDSAVVGRSSSSAPLQGD